MDFFFTTFWGKMLSTYFFAMLPIIELRGAIPYGLAQGLSTGWVYVTSVLGNMTPIPFILIFLRHIFRWLKTYRRTAPIIEWLESRAYLKGEKVEKYKMMGLFILVALPLPGTGAWTGALVSAILEIPLRKSFPIIFLGVCTAGIFMLLLSHGVIQLSR